MKIEHVATLFFALALLHTFLIPVLAQAVNRLQKEKAFYTVAHLLTEVELVFAFWALLFLIFWVIQSGVTPAFNFAINLNISEPLFILCIVMMASAKPILQLAQSGLVKVALVLSKRLLMPFTVCQVGILLTLGPLLGSVITEPAAITLVGLLLFQMITSTPSKPQFLYALLAVLFVNISIGGALTHFAAPPILMVARIWHWDFSSVFRNLGLASIIAVILNASIFTLYFKKNILQLRPLSPELDATPGWITLGHIILIGLAVVFLHQPNFLILILLLFFVFTRMTLTFQEKLRWKEAVYVALFLLGLLVLGSFQRWWLEPALIGLSEKIIFFAAVALTAVVDNAALTYLGAQVPHLSTAAQWALVSGALAGGGLTILANAPNPIGFALLSSSFPLRTLSSAKLFKAAIIPTLVAIMCFLIFGSF